MFHANGIRSYLILAKVHILTQNDFVRLTSTSTRFSNQNTIQYKLHVRNAQQLTHMQPSPKLPAHQDKTFPTSPQSCKSPVILLGAVYSRPEQARADQNHTWEKPLQRKLKVSRGRKRTYLPKSKHQEMRFGGKGAESQDVAKGKAMQEQQCKRRAQVH